MRNVPDYADHAVFPGYTVACDFTESTVYARDAAIEPRFADAAAAERVGTCGWRPTVVVDGPRSVGRLAVVTISRHQ